MIQGRVGVWDPSKMNDVIYEQPLREAALNILRGAEKRYTPSPLMFLAASLNII